MKNSAIMSVQTLLKLSAMTVFGSLISLTLLPVFVPIFTVFYIISIAASLLTKIKYGTKTQKATGTDVLSGKETTESRPIINIAFRFNGKFEVKKFRDKIWELINNSLDKNGCKRYRRMMQCYKKVFGYSVWMDLDNFNIDDHFKVVNLKDLVCESIREEMEHPVGNVDVRKIEQLKILMDDPENIDWPLLMKIFLNKYAAREMVEGRPKWDALLVKESETRYSALFRFHHSIADGVYFSRMLCEGFLGSPSELAHCYVPPNKFKKWLKYFWSFTLLPFGLWKIIKNNDKNVLHGPKLSGIKKYFLSKPLNLDDLRSIRTRTKASVHGVLFSCLSHALASHFKKRCTNVAKVTALIPIPLQNLQKPIELKNKYAVASLKIPTPPPSSKKERTDSLKKEKPDRCSLDRLIRIQKVIADAKTDPAFLSVHALITMVCAVLPSEVAESLLSANGCTINFSTLPGPTREITLWDDVIEELMFWIPDRNPLGVAVSIFSYNGLLRIGLSIDEALLEEESEGDIFVQNFLAEAENINNNLNEKANQEMENDKIESAKLLKNIP